ncbi:MAG TPA: AI-2E family transporter [Thermoanaerobaculia bacterium]|nr:AI-2E family transporter [Thermoanaerobaculia bacterium]
MPRARSIAFSVAAGALLAYLLWRVFAPFIEPIAWAAVLAILLMPAYRRLHGRLARRPNVAAFVATVLTILLVVVPGVLLAIALFRQGSRLYALAADWIRAHQLRSAADLFRIPALERAAARISGWFPVTSADLQAWLESGLKNVATRAAGMASGLAFGLLGMVVSFLIMIFTLFFFFRDGDALWAHFLAALPTDPAKTRQLVHRIDSILHAILLGTLLTALLQGVLGAIGFALFGLPSPVVFGAIMACLSLLPVGGTGLVWVPAGIVLLAGGAVGRGLGLLVWGTVIVGLADNWFKPMIISGHSEMNTLPVFFGVMGGLAAFGFLGLFVGPIVVALGIAVWDTAAAGREGEARAAPA